MVIRQGDEGSHTIGVVVCTYQRPERLERAVREVFAQPGVAERQFVVVVDDGSDDEGRTCATLGTLAADYGPRLVAIHHPANQGVAAARTTGVTAAIEHGAGTICFHDDDDRWEPNRLAVGAAPFADPTVAMTYADQLRIDDSFHRTGVIEVVWSSPTRSFRGMILDGLLRGRLYFPFQTAMFRAEVCRQLLPFMAVRESEDLDFAVRALDLIRRDPALRAVHIPEVLAYHVNSVDSLSATEENNRIREAVHREIFSRHLPRPVVGLMFGLSRRVLRPAGALLGQARRL